MSEEAGEYCDLVMKGGITSGLVYPNAAIALARRYRFKNVGGTSAGAIAAVACAAAAFGQRRKELSPATVTDSANAGFAGLEQVAHQLTTSGFIFSLFQPRRGAKTVYRLLVAAAGGRSLLRTLAAGAAAILWTGGFELVAILALLLGFAWWQAGEPGVVAALPGGLACAIAGGVVFGVLRVARTIRRNMLGICSGMPEAPGNGTPALTEWLHTIIQSLAGQQNGAPICFEDLWNAPRYPDEPTSAAALSLRVITSGISHHEPRSLPIEKNGGRFWFLREEFDLLFPKAVVDAMVAADPAPISVDGTTYYLLPPEGKLPLLVAARMSLSFPILISAIPLHEPDFAAARQTRVQTEALPDAPKPLATAVDQLSAGGARPTDSIPPGTPFRICWFSDGGICSNFPIHLFDAPLPRWPTFAIDLTEAGKDPESQKVWLPTRNNQGWQRRYSSIAAKLALGEIAGFLFGIVGTMQNWRDLLLSRAPGFRERIVRVPLTPEQGGMNLNMPAATLESVAAKGTDAGQLLVSEFDFDNHYWIRWRSVAATSEMFLNAFAVGAEPPISQSSTAAWSSASTGEPAAPSYKFTPKQNPEAVRRFALLAEIGREWGLKTPSLVPGAPRPQPRLVISPIY